MGPPPHTAYLHGYVGRTCVLTPTRTCMLYLPHRRPPPTAVASTVYGLRSAYWVRETVKYTVAVLTPMPRDGLKPITVSEEAWRAVKQLTEAEDTDFDTYDEFVRHSCTSADDHFGVLDEEVREGIEDGA